MYGMYSMVSQGKIITFKQFGKKYELVVDWSVPDFLELVLYDETAIDYPNSDVDPIYSKSVPLLDDDEE